MEAIRSERKMDFTKLSDNNPEIGPGSYDPVIKRSVKPSASAFCTGAERTCDAGAAKFITPGPGSYVSGEKQAAMGGFSSSTFASNTVRFKPKPCDGNPAPGAYQPPQGMAAKAAKLAQRAPDADNPPVQWKRMQTAPSIPAKHQSYGFRKSADRGIVALNNKDTKKKTTAPVQVKYKGMDWSRNKTERFPPKKSDKQPGPGAYTATSSPEPVRRPQVRSTGGQSYQEVLNKKRLEEAAAVPGPGSYGCPDKSGFDKSVESKLAGKGFGSLAERFKAKVTTGEIGPGQYDDTRQAIQLKNSHPLATHITPFGTTSNRFGRSAADEKVPGPGSYIEHTDPTATTKSLRNLGQFQGGFGSCSSRFDGTTQGTGTSQDVGPGTYDSVPDREVTEMLEKRRHLGMSSTFMSKASREKVITKSLGLQGQADQPAPGDYTIEASSISVVNANAEKPFNTSDKRWKSKAEEKYPPPGAYAAEQARLSLPRRGRDGKPVQSTKGAFNVNAKRFSEKPVGVGRRTKQPGPGQYSDGLQSATTQWQKPTYNISIRRSEMAAKKLHV